MNRIAKRGGGVEILATKGVVSELLSDYSTFTDDYKVLPLTANKNIVLVVYRPPNGNNITFLFLICSGTVYVYKNK